jgi:energy-coupling factor transporter ATP-binding protein EcfA2
MTDPERLPDRMEALRRLVAAAEGYLPPDRLAAARATIDRAGERLALSRSHTVVALAGATGSGKSSLFNAMAGAELSRVAFRRPTTGATHACVWGSDDAGSLLEWLGVPSERRFTPAFADADLNGLVLLDLPDFDSVEREHRFEVDRLLALVDLVVWVLDPQKYGDRLVHETYLAEFHRHRDITVVLLNQADRLDPADLARCTSDLAQMLKVDGLGGVPVLATSSVGPPGLAALRETVVGAVSARLAALRRLGADVDGVLDGLAPTLGSTPPKDLDRPSVRVLTDALAHAAGVPVVAAATGSAYRHRAIAATGWPVVRWVRRLRPDPLRRLRLGGQVRAVGPVAATSVPPPSAAARAEVGLALRQLADRSAGGLPDPWPEATLAAARSAGRLSEGDADDLADGLDVAVARTDLGLPVRRPLWWRAVGAVQWVATLAALIGLLWLGLRVALFALGLPQPPMAAVGRLPMPTLLLLGGVLASLLLSVLTRPVIHVIARRRRRRAALRLRAAVESVVAERVLPPVRAVLRAYRDARAAFDDAGS